MTTTRSRDRQACPRPATSCSQAGGVAERLKAPVLKTGVRQRTVGSNPSSSAKFASANLPSSSGFSPCGFHSPTAAKLIGSLFGRRFTKRRYGSHPPPPPNSLQRICRRRRDSHPAGFTRLPPAAVRLPELLRVNRCNLLHKTITRRYRVETGHNNLT